MMAEAPGAWIPEDLESVALRLARADEAAFEITKRSLEWSHAGGRGPLDVHQVEDPPGNLSLVVTKIRPIAPVVAMLFSEAIGHLRAAIDNTVFALVKRQHARLDERQTRRIAMPIYDEKSKLDKWFKDNERMGLSALGIGSDLSERIRGLQPFASEDSVYSVSPTLGALQGTVPHGQHPLLLLQGYSNEDKHRSIRIAAGRTLIQRDDESFLESDRAMRPVEVGDVLATTPKGKLVMVDSNAAVHVERPESAVWVSPARELGQLRAYVANVAVPVLATGISISQGFPPHIDLTDTGTTSRERIESASWEPAEERVAAISMEMLSDALSAAPTIPPIVGKDC